MIQIGVRGTRSSPAEWDFVRALPLEQVRPLSPEQSETARSLGISETDYARSVQAGLLGQERLIKKVEFFARVLNNKLRSRNPSAVLERVELDTLAGKFDASVQLNNANYPLCVDEELVDQLFERGSREADEAITRIVELLIPARVS